MPNPPKRLAGQKFGMLTALCRVQPDASGNTQWLCRCSCGAETTVRYQHLVTGKQKSCGHGQRRSRGRSLDTFSEEAFWG